MRFTLVILGLVPGIHASHPQLFALDIITSRWFYFTHASSLRLRSARAHFVRRPVGLASAPACLGEECHHQDCSGSENGPPKADKLFDKKKEQPERSED